MAFGTRPFLTMLGALALLGASTLSAAAQPATPRMGPQTADGRPEIRSDEVLVKFNPGTPQSDQAAIHRRLGGQVVREVTALSVKVVQVPAGQAERRARAYANNPQVEYAEPNGIAYVATAHYPNDPYYTNGSLWGLNNTGQSGGKRDADIDAPEAWRVTTGSPTVRVAVLDTGVRTTHPDLVRVGADGNLDHKVVLSRDWTAGDGDSTDDGYGHGTHVAGTIAAVTDNTEGIAGVCPECELINGKVLSDDGGGAYDWIASGVLWAAGCEFRDPPNAPLLEQNCVNDLGQSTKGLPLARVVNLSLGGTFNSRTLQDAVTVAWNQGVVLACAAGNSGSSQAFYPAAYPKCIAVAATDRSDKKASWSNFGSKWVDVAAPGVDIVSTLPLAGSKYASDTGYAFWSGTSMASPHVAGLAGLLWSLGATTTNDEVRGKIESTADAIGGTGRYWAKGRINACKALGGLNC